VERAQTVAAEMKVNVSIAVVDDRGDLIAFSRMAAAHLSSVDDAIGKAVMSAILVRASGPVGSGGTSKAFRDINERTGNRMRFEQGGLLVTKGGRLVGAVGISGSMSPRQDEAIARSTLDAIK
jgi:uncharacterized protein GlcG (DUF336 family)